MTRARRAARAVSFCALASLLLGTFARAAVIPLGNEFQVNSFTPGNQALPSVAAAAGGDFVIVWQSYQQDGSSFGVFARRFSSTGTALAGEFQVNTHTQVTQQRPSVAAAGGGDFVVVWESYGQEGSFDYGVFGRRFSSAGAALSIEFKVNTPTADSQDQAAVAVEDDDDLVIVWRSALQDGEGSGIFARRLSSAGAALGGEFQVNSYTVDSQSDPAVAAGGGGFVIAWNSPQDGQLHGIFARRFSSAGAALASEFQVNTRTVGSQSMPGLTMDGAGNFVVAWESYSQDGELEGVFARRFSSVGTTLATEFQVNTHTLNRQRDPVMAMEADGDFLVVWRSSFQDGSTAGVFARRYSSAGAPLAAEFQVNTRTVDYQNLPAVAADDAGRFVIAWQSSTGQDGSSYGVFAQRLYAIALDVDGDGSTLPLTDGLLALRHLFGFEGVALTANAVALGGCARCDADAIEAYLGALVVAPIVLDVDGDGEALALTDGLLTLRYLFGFRGTPLTAGAVDSGDCERCDATEIEPYLAGLVS